MPKYTRNKIKENKKKVDTYTPTGTIAPEDMPKVGDIWKLTTQYGISTLCYHYLLLDSDSFGDARSSLTFDMLELETGERMWMFMNFELDDWHRIE